MDTLIQYAKKIILTHQQNFFSFKFAALNYSSPHKNQYAYQLEGVDRDWVYTDASNRLASYTDISPGTYVFRVKGSNNDGVWNEEGTSIQVIILPPWWRTSWAYAAYILLIGFAVAGTWRMQVRRLHMKHQLEIEHLQASKLQEIDRVKSRFFANISHEFRTPLTLILGPLEKMLSRTTDEESREDLGMMQRSAFRLHRLIDQLLDLSKLEAGKMKLQAREVNLTDFLKPLILAFTSWAETRKITLTFVPPGSPILICLDPEMMEKVMSNLISNALKFTATGGKVEVIINNPPVSPLPSGGASRTGMHKGGNKGGSGEYIEITVADSGPGIPPDKLPRIFDRFFQLDDSSTRHHEGSGIGLALTKELVELNHGKITVESEVGKGSTFTIQLPLGKEHLEADEIVEVPEKTEAPTELSHMREFANRLSDIRDDDGPTEVGTRLKEQGSRNKLPTLLIVEDHADMKRYMADYLEKEYRIMTAVDGKDGFEKSTREHFDLIISDVMMPGIDGFELCKKLKTDERTSHIPIILLTAKADAGSKLKGLETGADDYITKPFDVKELQLRVRNLIEQRRKLRERFQKELKVEPRRLAVTSLDQRLLQSVLRVVEKNLGNPQFGGERLVKELGMSRANLHRKLKALTNHSAGSFIQAVRLKKAAQLIEQKFDTITQIAYLVGFNNPSYFSECFRRQFGCTPSEYSHQDN